MPFVRFLGNSNDDIIIDPAKVIAVVTSKDTGTLSYVYVEGRQSFTVVGSLSEVSTKLGITY